MERGLTNGAKLTGLICVHHDINLIIQIQGSCALVSPLLITATSLGVVGEMIDLVCEPVKLR